MERFAEFDASALPEGAGIYFCWHPRNPGCSGCWARKKDAQRFAIPYETQSARFDEESGEDLPSYWQHHAGHSIPLYAVARVVGKQEMARTFYDDLYVIEFDYGDAFMRGTQRIGFLEKSLGVKGGWRLFDDEAEYQTLLVKARKVYDDMEAAIKAARESKV
jgi:hypothetical protein